MPCAAYFLFSLCTSAYPLLSDIQKKKQQITHGCLDPNQFHTFYGKFLGVRSWQAKICVQHGATMCKPHIHRQHHANSFLFFQRISKQGDMITIPTHGPWVVGLECWTSGNLQLAFCPSRPPASTGRRKNMPEHLRELGIFGAGEH